jgi:exopolysaccharide biosynthesis polyprenyl glycosylphosphotransferase
MIIAISFSVAYIMRFGIEGLIRFDFHLQFVVFFSSNIFAWLIVSNWFHLYSSKRFYGLLHEFRDVIKTTALCLVIAAIPAFFLRQEPLSRLFLLYFWPIQTSALILFRLLVRNFLRYIRLQGYNFRQVILIGRNQRTENIAKRIQDTPEYGVRILGYLDDTNNSNGFSRLNKLKFLGKLADLEKILRYNIVDEVIVTLPIKSFYSEIERILNLCELVGVEVKIPIDFFSKKLAKLAVSDYHDFQIIDFYTSPKMNWQLLGKRLIDITVSILLIVILSPILVLIALIIKTTSKGPVIFAQDRLGYNGRHFKCLKFRSMIENAESLKDELAGLNEMDGPVFKIKNDPRVTKVGRFLRKTSIDELPQLINVLKGDMSLVGPRPPIPGEVCNYDIKDRRRLSMKPGLTCIWQVNGRNSIPFEKWMDLDKNYIDNWSLWMDLKILARTIPAVVKGSNAA